MMKESRFIEQVMVVGENQKFPAAIIVPAFTFLRDWCIRKDILQNASIEEMINDQLVIDRIQREVDTINSRLGSYEAIKKFVLLPKEWTIDAGELTPKLSLKRRVIMQQQSAAVERIYAEK